MDLKRINVTVLNRHHGTASWKVPHVACIFDRDVGGHDLEIHVENGEIEEVLGHPPLRAFSEQERNSIRCKAIAAYAIAFPEKIQ